MTVEIHLELLLGQKVFDAAGAEVGRVEEIEAEGDRITHVLTGQEAILQRLWGLHRVARRRPGYRIRWDQLQWASSGPLTANVAIAALERL